MRAATFCARWLGHLGMLVLPVVLLVALALGLGYVRLRHGPVSIKILARPIAQGIAAEMPGAKVSIDDVVISLAPRSGVEFRLSNLRISEPDGDLIASAPMAAVELSLAALQSFRISPARVDLIEPAFALGFSEDGRLALSFSSGAAEPVAGGASGGAARAAPPPAQETRAPGYEATRPSAIPRQFDVVHMFAEATARARQRVDAVSFLREIGVRDATVTFDRAGRKSRLTVSEMSVDLEHRKRRSVIAGTATIASGKEPWSVSFHTEDNEVEPGRRSLMVKSSIRGLRPGMLTAVLPELAGIEAAEVPLAADAELELSPEGSVTSGKLAIELGRGQIRLPTVTETSAVVDGGLLTVVYDGTSRRFELTPSTVVSGHSRVTLVGEMTSELQTDGSSSWPFRVRVRDGVLGAEEFKLPALPIESASVEGVVLPAAGIVRMASATVKAGGASGRATGEVAFASGLISARFEGGLSPMNADTLKTMWPQILAPSARQWVGQRLNRAQLKSGTFKFSSGSYRTPQEPVGRTDFRVTATFEASDVQFLPATDSPPIDAPRALIRVENETVEVNIPDAVGIVSAKGRVPLKAIRFWIADSRPDIPIGEVSVKAVSPLLPILELADLPQYEVLKKNGVKLEGADGKFEGQFKIVWPLTPSVDPADVKVEGKGRIFDGKVKQIGGAYDVQGAAINFDISDKAVDAKGEMLVAGVPAKLVWQRIFDAPPDKQPPLRVTATIDNADRTQLGLDINHMVQGEVAIDLTVQPQPQGEPKVELRADLTGAELIVENMAWKKPAGRSAILQCDIVKGKTHKLELQNFKLAGENIAIEGWAAIGADNQLREFSFPDFSLNVVTRLEVHGTLRQDHVWEVKAKGSTYDGRDFFRSLFHVGQISDKAVKPLKPRAGVDLEAEIGTIIGFSEVSLRNLKMKLSKRADKLTMLDGTGALDGGAPVSIRLAGGTPTDPRRLIAEAGDAGLAFKLVGFYPNAQGGHVKLGVNLDGSGSAELTGVLWVEKFRILGDAVLSEVVGSADAARPSGDQRRRTVTREVFDFDRMKVPFSVGHGQFALEDSYLNGPLLGLNLRGKADFNARTINLSGTYIPLQGLNNILADVPLLSQILSGPRAEGIFGITFAIQGAMAQPQVIVNPLAMLTPGIFRGFMELANPDTTVRAIEAPKPAAPAEKRVRASSTAAEPAPVEAKAKSTPPPASPTAAGAEVKKAAPKPKTAPAAQPVDGWSSTTAPVAPKKETAPKAQ